MTLEFGKWHHSKHVQKKQSNCLSQKQNKKFNTQNQLEGKNIYIKEKAMI